MAKKFTQLEFIQKSKIIHGDKYDYSLVKYINTNTKILLKCDLHGYFTQTPNKHLLGQGCALCGDISRKNTNIKRYGCEYPAQNKNIQEKAKQTNIERYGVEYTFQCDDVKEKIKQKNIEMYGVENPSQSKIIQKKKKETCLNNHGNEYPLQVNIIQEKMKKTMVEKYGVEFSLQSDEIKEKIKRTNVARYGFIAPIKNNNIKNKVKQTNIERYGVEYISQSHIIKEKSKKSNEKKYGVEYASQKHLANVIKLFNNYDWLYDQYITLNKTPEQISKEFNTSKTTILRYLHKNKIDIQYIVGYSLKCIQWLDSIMEKEGIFIQHALNGGEYRLPGTRYKVDGFNKETNTVYEFHGDCFHGNPDIFKGHETPNFYQPNVIAKTLYKQTIKRENEIINLGYNLVSIWENTYNSQRFFD